MRQLIHHTMMYCKIIWVSVYSVLSILVRDLLDNSPSGLSWQTEHCVSEWRFPFQYWRDCATWGRFLQMTGAMAPHGQVSFSWTCAIGTGCQHKLVHVHISPRHFNVDNWVIFGWEIDQWDHNLYSSTQRYPKVSWISNGLSLCFQPSKSTTKFQWKNNVSFLI
jgi:hypothetical protein